MTTKDDLGGGRLITPPTQYHFHGDPEQAARVAQDNSSAIGAFIHAQRQQVRLAGLDQHKHVLEGEDYHLLYEHKFGQERVTVTSPPVYPEEAPLPKKEEKEDKVEPNPEQPPFEYELVNPILLVLFKDNEAAGFDMSSLNSKGTAYLTAQRLYKDCSWGADIIKTCQINTNGIRLVMTEIDLSGKKKNLENYIVTQANFVTSVDTTTEVPHVPIMNARGNVVWTARERFTIDDKGEFSPNGTPGDPGMMPYAIGADGVYYYDPIWSSNTQNTGIRLGFAYPYGKGGAYSPISEVPGVGEPPIPDDMTHFYGATLTLYTDLINREEMLHQRFSRTSPCVLVVEQCDIHAATSTIFNKPGAGASIMQDKVVPVGRAYVSSSRGGAAAPYTFVAISSPTYYLDNDLAASKRPSNSYPLPNGVTDLSGSLPWPIYKIVNGLDVIDTKNVQVSADVNIAYSNPRYTSFDVLGRDIIRGRHPSGIIPGTAANDNLLLGGTGPVTVREQGQYGVFDRSYYDVYIPEEDFTYIGWSDGAPGVIESHVGPVGTYQALFDLEDQYVPKDGFLSESLPALKTQFMQVWDYVNDTSGNTAKTQYFMIEPFPYSFDKKPYYTVVLDAYSRDESPIEVHTPYGVFQSDKRLGFKPWCHVSNGKHVIQGFLIDDEPKVYLNGVDFMPFLTKTLDCQASDIKALYMDVPLVNLFILKDIQR